MNFYCIEHDLRPIEPRCVTQCDKCKAAHPSLAPPAATDGEGKIKIKLRTPQARERFEMCQQASAEIDGWPAEQRAEAARCPCKVYCGHPVQGHKLITQPSQGVVVCELCPPREDAARPDGETAARDMKARARKWLLSRAGTRDEPDLVVNVTLIRLLSAFAALEVSVFRGLVQEIFDLTTPVNDPQKFTELASAMAERGWFKRASKALGREFK